MVIEEIRQAVAEGFQRFARGGIEVGGVLYGIVDGTTVRILAVREMACEHATGPSFHLSEKDLSALTEQLERNRTDPRLEGFAPLGFYVSHTRSDIVLMPGEFEIYNSRLANRCRSCWWFGRGALEKCARDFSCGKPTAR